eukprot:scaffold109883_cov37-Tisochrysis_lutea.AAC.2
MMPQPIKPIKSWGGDVVASDTRGVPSGSARYAESRVSHVRVNLSTMRALARCIAASQQRTTYTTCSASTVLMG